MQLPTPSSELLWVLSRPANSRSPKPKSRFPQTNGPAIWLPSPRVASYLAAPLGHALLAGYRFSGHCHGLAHLRTLDGLPDGRPGALGHVRTQLRGAQRAVGQLQPDLQAVCKCGGRNSFL